jgi:hypothetical protein
MALVPAGFDVFSPEVDDKGIDFVLRVDGHPPRYHDVQVEIVRRTTYVSCGRTSFGRPPTCCSLWSSSTRAESRRCT